MGPGWLRLVGAAPSAVPASWCTYDMVVASPKNVTKVGVGKDGAAIAGDICPPVPHLVVLSLSVKTVPDAKKRGHEVVAVAMVTHTAVDADGPSPEGGKYLSARTLVRPRSGEKPLPADLPMLMAKLPPGSVGREANERALLNCVLNAIAKVRGGVARGCAARASSCAARRALDAARRRTQVDPDVLVGHNILGWDLDVLLARMTATGAQQWSRLGRLRRSTPPRVSLGASGRPTHTGSLAVGRLVCDTYLAARELVRETTYTLEALAAAHLGVAKKPERDGSEWMVCPAATTSRGAHTLHALLSTRHRQARSRRC